MGRCGTCFSSPKFRRLSNTTNLLGCDEIPESGVSDNIVKTSILDVSGDTLGVLKATDYLQLHLFGFILLLTKPATFKNYKKNISL